MNDKFGHEDVYLFDVQSKIQWNYRRTGMTGNQGERQFTAPNEPNGLVINYFLKGAPAGKVTIRVTTPYGEEIAVLEGKTAQGLNSVLWDMRRGQAQPQQPPQQATPTGRGMVRMAPPGEYVVTLEIGDKKWTRRTSIRRMPGAE
jgi:hypothetical protein